MALEQNKQSCLIESDEFFLSEGTNNLHDGICLPTGEILCDRFIIKKQLGNSNNSIFYLAKDTLRKMELVIKAVDVGPCGKKFAAIQLKLEMDIYKKLSDPNIINVYDLHSVIIGGAKLLIMTMDYAEKGSFKRWLADSNDVDIRRTKGMKFFKQICRGLGAAHDQDIINLDINPENILLTNKFLKISNFALSNHVQIELLSAGHNLDSFFKSASCPAYMSPELFNTPHPDELTAAADVYSLGIMLYELYHPKCRTPFSGSYSHIRDLHLNVPIKKIENLNDNLSDIISRCLEKDPGKRYQNAWELLEALEKKSKKKTKILLKKNGKRLQIFMNRKILSMP
jgi:serine/threonine protein kinase